MRSKIAFVIISSLPRMSDHLSNVMLLVKMVGRLVYLKSMSWKKSFASKGEISLNPTSSIINNLYLKKCFTRLSKVPS